MVTTFKFVLVITIVSVAYMSIIYCTIVDYDNGIKQHTVSEAEYDAELRVYKVKTVDNYRDSNVKLFVFSDSIEKSTLIENAKVKIKSPLGIEVYINKNILIAKPDIDLSRMSNSEKKSYIKGLNDRKYILK